jgi:hypothetical protein
MAHEVAAKPGIEREHRALPEERHDLGDHPAQAVTMEHGKPLQDKVCASSCHRGWQFDLHRLGVKLHRLGVNNMSDSSELLTQFTMLLFAGNNR